MNQNDTTAKPAREQPDQAKPAESRYEPPRIVSKRSVERVTLLSGSGLGSGSGIGGY